MQYKFPNGLIRLFFLTIMESLVSTEHETLSGIIKRMREGDPEAARIIYERFAAELLAFTRRRISPKCRPRFDEEDILQSVFRSFFARQTSDTWDIHNWETLRAVLMVMARRKCGRQIVRHRSQRRSVEREIPLELARDPIARASRILVAESAESQAISRERFEQALVSLSDRECEILQLFLDFHTPIEIADRLGCAARTVRRAVDKFRHLLSPS
jgi:RNA polymerase sigma-70 factor (ECF subfamily)